MGKRAREIMFSTMNSRYLSTMQLATSTGNRFRAVTKQAFGTRGEEGGEDVAAEKKGKNGGKPVEKGVVEGEERRSGPDRVLEVKDHVDTTKLVSGVSRALEAEVVGISFEELKRQDQSTLLFAGKKEAKIGIKDYLFRLVKYLNAFDRAPPELRSIGCRSLMVAVVYLKRFASLNPGFLLVKENVHRFIAVAMLEAVKFLEDEPISHEFFAKGAGISVEEINILEVRFVKMMKFRLYIRNEDVEDAYQQFYYNDKMA